VQRFSRGGDCAGAGAAEQMQRCIVGDAVAEVQLQMCRCCAEMEMSRGAEVQIWMCWGPGCCVA